MKKSMLITGGARSGKSRYAEERTLELGARAYYIATAEAYDDEMRARIAEHQARRGPEWHNLHATFDLVETLRAHDEGPPRLVDCLTLWLTNMMLAERDWETAVSTLCETIPALSSPVFFVSNEVGDGIVPDNALARAFRDAAGRMNQQVASACDGLVLVVAGHPLEIK
ncbi:MAG: bifunctional adenosylcobinamide kinase/adenosylcobinamide-phosphate guanylyltransferase [Marinovum sp.]|nr:bifunctional adenosylcobinamide kinase/adenosylcobinamide-phosphate guanylyltransferase [Marinovum sp.]